MTSVKLCIFDYIYVYLCMSATIFVIIINIITIVIVGLIAIIGIVIVVIVIFIVLSQKRAWKM